MNWPTQQSFFCKAILDAPKKRVCSHVDSFAVRLRSNYPFPLLESWSGDLVGLVALVIVPE